ncbi:hypothetical protein NCCP1664_17760 [Zafaria cholistanensis]|uniref:Uncharacterized protein n=1 Tax=Zafaria cholistanensis TaxID=1682741 RepID=A0A5A7NR52_9MICC|nr:hypothetical protein NCCP1664_17760 [Zafaria cholistanensis]
MVGYLDGERVDATRHSMQSWVRLQESEEHRRLVMPGCGIRAVAKARGETRFFSHVSLAGCTAEHRGETEQHCALKAAVAGRIDTVPGWHALVEYQAPSRE